MHNLKDIRKDFENFKNKLKARNIDIDIENLKTLDEKNRKLIQKKESLPEKLNLDYYHKRKIAENPYGLNKSKLKNKIYVLKEFLKNILLKPNLKNIYSQEDRAPNVVYNSPASK